MNHQTIYKTAEETAIHTSYFSIAGNIGIAVIKGLAGFFGNSHALIADAIESFADVFSSVFVLLGLRYARRPADENHPYGHGRIEPLITFVVVGFLLISATLIAYETIRNLNLPREHPKGWTLWILGAIIIWKEISFRLVIKRSRETNSTSLMADAWHHRTDALTSIAAFTGISLALLLDYQKADDWAALFAAGIILYNSYLIFRPALGEIMDEHVYDDLIQEIREVSVTVKGVKDTEKCFVRKSGLKYHIDLHATVDGDITVRKGHDIAHDLKDTLAARLPQLGNILIHIEPDQ